MRQEFITISQEQLILLCDRKVINNQALAFFALMFQAKYRPEIPFTCANLEPMAKDWGLSKIQLRGAIAELKSKGVIARDRRGLPPRERKIEFKEHKPKFKDPRQTILEKLG